MYLYMYVKKFIYLFIYLYTYAYYNLFMRAYAEQLDLACDAPVPRPSPLAR